MLGRYQGTSIQIIYPFRRSHAKDMDMFAESQRKMDKPRTTTAEATNCNDCSSDGSNSNNRFLEIYNTKTTPESRTARNVQIPTTRSDIS